MAAVLKETLNEAWFSNSGGRGAEGLIRARPWFARVRSFSQIRWARDAGLNRFFAAGPAFYTLQPGVSGFSFSTEP
jgi:hypothetical protein